MTSRDRARFEDQPTRPVLATGLQGHRVSARKASPSGPRSSWRRPATLVPALALALIGMGALLHMQASTDAGVARPTVVVEPVLEATVSPDSVASAALTPEAADVVPTVAATPVLVPTSLVLQVSMVSTPPAPTATPAATPTPEPAAATAAPKPMSTPEATSSAAPEATSSTVWVANTGGSGVYVRGTPAAADRIRAYPDRTPLTIIGNDVSGEGQQWKHVRTPDGLEGYVPSVYTTDTAP